MNNNYTKLLSAFVGLLFGASAIAQPINENFQNVPALFSSGWAQQNLSTPVGTNPNWFQGNSTVFVANSAPDSSYIAVNFNSVAGNNTISNWLFAPNRTFNNGDVISFFTRTVDGTYPDRLEVRLSTNGTSTNVGSTNTSVGDFTTLLLTVNPTLTTTGYPTVWTQYTITISGLAGPTSGRIAFRYFVTNGGPSGANSDYIGIDNFVYTPVGGGTPNVTASHLGEYTLIPYSQLASMPLSARINNIGTASTSDATLTVRVFQAPNFNTPVFTQTSSNTTIAAGGNQVINVGSYTPSALATYVYQYISNCTNNTITSADTSTYAFTVVADEYARDNGQSVQGVGAGNTISCIIGNNFQINNTTTMDSVLFFVYPGAAGLGDTVRVRIANTVSGVPSNTSYVGFSAPYRFTAADTGGAVIVLPVTNLTSGPLTLAPGNYFVGLEKYLTSDNYGLQCANTIFTPNTVYANINNGTYSPLNSLIGFNYTPIIRPILNCRTAGVHTVTACGSYTWINGQTYTSNNNTATHVIQNVAGCDSTITLNLTITPLDNATFTYPSNTICEGGPNTTPTLATAGGTFSSTPAGLVFANATTGEINVIASSSGVYSVTYTTAGTCPNTQTQTITITNTPDASFSYANSAYCVNGTNPTPIITGSVGTFTSSPPGLSIASGTGEINLAASTPGNYIVTNTIAASGTCPQATATDTVTVNALPTATISGGGAACAGNNIPLSIALTGAGPWNFTYSDGTNSTPVSGHTTSPYTFNASTSGTYTVTTVSDANCSNTGSGSATVTINPLPTVTFTLSNTNVCSSAAPFALSGGSPAGGTYTGAGVSGGQFNAATAGVGTHTITYTFTDSSGCSASATQNITVSVCPGMEESSIAKSLLIAPNPAREQIMISFNNANSKNVQVTIISADGKVVYSENAAAAQYVKYVDVTSFAKGLYFIQIVSEEGMINNKIIVQ